MKRAQRAAERLRDVAKQIERGVSPVQIQLAWGTVEWRASLREINGKSRDGTPFLIPEVAKGALIQWLRGSPVKVAFPKMEAYDRALLCTGLTTDVPPKPDETLLRPRTVVHPGEIVREHMSVSNYSAQRLAAITGLPPGQIRAICACNAPITITVAIGLARAFNRETAFWVALQRLYDEQ